jgi:phage gp36-like protein
MAYTTHTKVRELLKAVTVTAMSNTEVEGHIARADSIIDGYIAQRYSLPLGTTPAIIETVSTELAAYYVGRAMHARDTQTRNDWIDDFRNNAIATLKMIAAGELLLISSAGAVIAASESMVHSNNSDYTPVFDVDDIINQSVDADKLDAIADERE